MHARTNEMSRRRFLSVAAGGAAALLAGVGHAAALKAPRKRPNIVLIFADDMGFSDLGCYGSEIRTPNLDGLAAQGVRFTQFYNAARCCPSRASLLTGLYPHQAGMGGMVSKPGDPAPAGPYQGYLNDRCVTIAEVLKKAGYATYMSGKWHVGEAPEHWPRKRGFDRYFGLISGASSYWEILDEKKKRVMALDDEPYTPTPGKFYMTDAFTDFAVERIREHPDSSQPFLLYLAFTAPHWPLHAWPEDIARYEGKYLEGWDQLREQRYRKQVDLGIIDSKYALAPRDPDVPAWESVDNKQDWDRRMAVYAAMIDRLDQGVGRVLQALDEKGAAKDTLVIFLADNGGCHEGLENSPLHDEKVPIGARGSYAACKRPWANASNTPFRMFKHWTHEGGIATPCIVRWPGVVPEPGGLAGQVGHINDIMATCIDVAGAEYPGLPIVPLEGKSLVPILEGRTREPHEALVWEHMGNRAVRMGRWKLVAAKKAKWELYDLDKDRTELHNLIEEHPEQAKQMDAVFAEWAKKTGARLA